MCHCGIKGIRRINSLELYETSLCYSLFMSHFSRFEKAIMINCCLLNINRTIENDRNVIPFDDSSKSIGDK